MIPNNATSSTATVAGNVFNEIVSITIYVLKTYETPLVGIAIMFIIAGAIYGVIKLFGNL
jgi:hypothetical protein